MLLVFFVILWSRITWICGCSLCGNYPCQYTNGSSSLKIISIWTLHYLKGYRSKTLKIEGSSNSYAFTKFFPKILQGPILLRFILLSVPLGNLSFLIYSITKSQIWKLTSLLFKFSLCLYFPILYCDFLLTFSCISCILNKKYSPCDILLSCSPKHLSSYTPLGCIHNI